MKPTTNLIVCSWAAFAYVGLIGTPVSAAPLTDVNMLVSGGRVVTSGGTWTGTFAGRVFGGNATLVSGTLLTTTNPGFYANTFSFPLATSGAQPRLRLDFTKELLYWSGTALAAPAAGLRVSYGGREAWITGTDTAGKPGIFLATAASRGFHEHATFAIPRTAPNGLYGFTFALGPDGASVGTFEQSLPVLMVIETGTTLSAAAKMAGMNALVNAALVPEPSTLGLAAAALGIGCLVAGRARVRRSRRTRGLRPDGAASKVHQMCTCNTCADVSHADTSIHQVPVSQRSRSMRSGRITLQPPRSLASVVAACVCAALFVSGAQADPVSWTSGHGDIKAKNHDGASEFDMEVHLHEGAVVSGTTLSADADYAPGDALIVVPLAANLRAISTGSGQWASDTAGYNFLGMGSTLGVAEGGNLWVLSFNLSDADVYGTPFIGWKNEYEGLPDGYTVSDVTFTPFLFVSPTGGNMGVFDQDNSLSPLWVLNHGDTTFSGDSLVVQPDTEIHRVLAFTKPGLYEVGIRASAVLNGDPIQGEGVYKFQVVPEPSSVALAGLGAAGVLAAGWRRRRLAAGRISTATEIAG